MVADAIQAMEKNQKTQATIRILHASLLPVERRFPYYRAVSLDFRETFFALFDIIFTQSADIDRDCSEFRHERLTNGENGENQK